jgi:lysyl-tRNA synthetase class 1
MSRSTPQGEPHDWVTRAADDAIRHHEKSGASGPVTCSSGISPSGPIHLGNLREFLMPHFVADELRRRGVPVRHLHVWDDYDRFRKVPAGVDPSWAEHIGRPYTAVPDPWQCHATWSDHYKEPVRQALQALGVDMEEISQTERYRAGVYREEVLRAVRARKEIDDVLAKYRTRRPATMPRRRPRRWRTRSPTTTKVRPGPAPPTSATSRSSRTAATAVGTRPR